MLIKTGDRWVHAENVKQIRWFHRAEGSSSHLKSGDRILIILNDDAGGFEYAGEAADAERTAHLVNAALKSDSQ